MGHRRLLAGAAGFSLAALVLRGPGAGAGDLYRFTSTSHGRGVNAESGAMPITAGLATSVTNYVVEAGSSFGSHHHEHNAPSLVIIKRGSAVEYTSCTDRKVLEAGHTYLHQPGHHDHSTLLRNEGPEPVEMEVVYFDESADNPSGIDGRPDPPPAGCPTLF